MKNIKQAIVIGFLAIIIVMSGCSEQSTPTTPTTPTAEAPPVTPPPATETQSTTATPTAPSGELGIKQVVAISGYTFSPDSTNVPTGASVAWSNMDDVDHTIVFDNGTELGSDLISQGKEYVHNFSTAGTYTYHCGIHPAMTGTIIVG